MSTLLWIMAAWFLANLFGVVTYAAKRKIIQCDPSIAVIYFVINGFFITVLVLAAQNGVTP